MRPAENINKLIKKLRYKAGAETHERILGNVLQALDKFEKQKSGVIAPNRWRTIMKSPITKLAAAAVIIIAVLIGIHQLGGSIDGTTVALAQVIENTKKMPWMHAISKEYYKGKEWTDQKWYHCDSNKAFEITSDGNVWCWDYGVAQKQYFYDLSMETLTISNLPKGEYYSSDSAHDFLDVILRYVTQEGAVIHEHIDKFNDTDVRVYEIERNMPNDAMGIGGKVVAKMKFTIRAYIRTKLVPTLKIEFLDENSEVIRYSNMEMDYPETGPEDIYALGVPRTAKIVDKTDVAPENLPK